MPTEAGDLILRIAAARNAGDMATADRLLERLKVLKPEWAEEDDEA